MKQLPDFTDWQQITAHGIDVDVLRSISKQAKELSAHHEEVKSVLAAKNMVQLSELMMANGTMTLEQVHYSKLVAVVVATLTKGSYTELHTHISAAGEPCIETLKVIRGRIAVYVAGALYSAAVEDSLPVVVPAVPHVVVAYEDSVVLCITIPADTKWNLDNGAPQ